MLNRLDPRTFDPTKPIVMARFQTVGGHAMGAGDPLKIVDEPKDAGEVDLDTATRLWSTGTFVYADQARPTPVESPQDAARRQVEMEPLDNGYYLIRAPWLAEAEKVHGLAAAEARRDELIAAGEPLPEGAPAAPVAIATSGETETETAAQFQLVEAGSNGWFEITGPGLDEPVKVRGKEAAEAKLAELQGAPAQPGTAEVGTAGTGTGDAAEEG
jgi:hypothetical protein